MDPSIVIVSALVAGATEYAKTASAKVVKDGFAALKALIQRKYGQKSDLLDALAKVESRPDSEARQGALKEELQFAKAESDNEVVIAARQLLNQLAQQGQAAGFSYTAGLSGSDAIAQGSGSVAAGRGGVAIGGDVTGSTITTGSHISGDFVGGDKVLGSKIERQINTGGGAFIGGSVKVAGGDFVGRDQLSDGKKRTSDVELSAEGNKLAGLLCDFFSEQELRDIGEQHGQNRNLNKAGNRQATAQALVAALERSGQIHQLKLLMRVARPQLRRHLS